MQYPQMFQVSMVLDVSLNITSVCLILVVTMDAVWICWIALNANVGLVTGDVTVNCRYNATASLLYF